MSGRIAVGIIRKAHGVRGEASVEPWTDDLDRFDDLEEVTLASPDDAQTRDTTIQAFRFHAGRVLVKFAGIDTPEDVQLLRGWTLEIPEEQARTLGADEYFLHDLPGLTLIDAEGRERGVVTDVFEGGGGLLLNVRRADGKEFELPFAADLCTEIDIPGRKIMVNLPEGLEDLDGVSE